MAVLTLRFQSKLLGFSTAVRILIPTEWGKEFDYKAYYENKEKLPVLWLLHGGSDNYADWHDCTTVQILADQYKIASSCRMPRTAAIPIWRSDRLV